MIRLLVLYPQTQGARFDFDYYLSKHIPMGRKLAEGTGVEYQVDQGVAGMMPGTPAPFVAIALLTAPSMEVLQQYLATHGPALMSDIPNYTDIQPVVQVSEVVG